MANLFVDLPLPALNGLGASVATGGMGAPKTVTVVGDFPGCTVAIMVSVDGGVNFAPIWTFTDAGGEKELEVAADFMCVRVAGRKAAVPFSANCDVGAPDTGALFTALPLPAMNGPGTPVDISTFGQRSTFISAGEFPGAVIGIEVSEDGVTYAAIGQFSAQGNLFNKVVTANWVRANVSGRKASLPFTATVAMGAINDFGTGGGGGGGGGGVLTFRPGSGLTGPIVFEDWDELYAELVSLRTAADESGRFTIVFDDSEGACVVPSNGNTYDMSFTEWLGLNWFGATEGGSALSQITPVVIGDADAADISVENLVQITGLDITTEQEVAPIRTDEVTLTLIGTRILGQADPVRTPLRMNASVLRLGDEATLEAGSSEVDAPAVLIASNSTLEIFIDGARAQILEAALGNEAGGTATVYMQSSSGIVELNDQLLTVPLAWGTNLFTRSGPFLAPLPADSGAINASSMIGYTIQLDDDSTVTLPPAAQLHKGELVAIKNITTAKDIDITPFAGNTIDGQAPYALVGDYAWVVLASDGNTTWNVISSGKALSSVSIYSPPEKWNQNDVSLGQTDVDLETLVSVNFSTIKMIRSGSIVGLSARYSETIVGGQATVTVTINGAAGTLAVISTSLSNADGGQSTQAPGIDTYVAGDEIGIQITTDVGFLPLTTDVEAWLQLAE